MTTTLVSASNSTTITPDQIKMTRDQIKAGEAALAEAKRALRASNVMPVGTEVTCGGRSGLIVISGKDYVWVYYAATKTTGAESERVHVTACTAI